MTLYTHLQAVNRTVQVAACIGLGLMIAGPAHAAGSGMPWEGPLDQILTSIEGPVARIVAVIIITITGLVLWAVGHSAAVFMARSDPDFMAVAGRSTRHKEHLTC